MTKVEKITSRLHTVIQITIAVDLLLASVCYFKDICGALTVL